jgi:hypothetical protein
MPTEKAEIIYAGIIDGDAPYNPANLQGEVVRYEVLAY